MRGLAAHLEALGLGESQGVTRHQLLVHPSVPYTTHNSALCLALDVAPDIDTIEGTCHEYLLARAVEGADPALCVAESRSVTPEVSEFGRRAQVSVLAVEDASGAAVGAGVALRSIAGGPEGVIGALAAVGLRACGDDGRFVDLFGIRDIQGVVSVERLLRETAVAAVSDVEGLPLAGCEQIDSQGWIRPSVMGGMPVLRVRPNPNRSERWVPYERRTRDSV